MRHKIYEVETCPVFLRPPVHQPTEEDLANSMYGHDRDFYVVFFSSGKSALFHVLQFFKSEGMIANKNDELLVQHWIGSWVHNISQKLIFPSLEFSRRTKGILVYHQYGYPQQMDCILEFAKSNNLFVIEDCAHALFSKDGTSPLGLRGEVGIFSLSKMFPTPMGGGIITKNKKMAEYLKNESKKSINWISRFSYLTKLLVSSSHLKFRKSKVMNVVLEMSYAAYDLSPKISSGAISRTVLSIANGSIEVRRKNQLRLISEIGEIYFPENSSNLTILPYVLPLISDSSILNDILMELRKYDFETGIYMFDVNRNILNPCFKPALWLPIHSGVTENDITLMVNICKKHLSNSNTKSED